MLSLDYQTEPAHLTLLSMGPSALYCEKGINEVGQMALSSSGKGTWFELSGRSYVIPTERIRQVLAGKHKKGPIFRSIRDEDLKPFHAHKENE